MCGSAGVPERAGPAGRRWSACSSASTSGHTGGQHHRSVRALGHRGHRERVGARVGVVALQRHRRGRVFLGVYARRRARSRGGRTCLDRIPYKPGLSTRSICRSSICVQALSKTNSPAGHRSEVPSPGRCPSSIQREGRDIPNNGRLLEHFRSGTLTSSDDPAGGRDLDGPTNGGLTSSTAGAVASAASREVIAMGVGAVMALHSVHEARARVALTRAASRYQVSVGAVAQAVLTLVADTDEPVPIDGAGRAAVLLLVQGFTDSP